MDKFEVETSNAELVKRAQTWKKFLSRLEESISLVKDLELKLLSNETIGFDEATKLFEDVVRSADPSHKTFEYYLRPILEAKSRSESSPETIVILAKCPKREKIGFCFDDIANESYTGLFLEAALYAFLQGTLLLSFTYQ
jgi:hypothetical protein